MVVLHRRRRCCTEKWFMIIIGSETASSSSAAAVLAFRIHTTSGSHVVVEFVCLPLAYGNVRRVSEQSRERSTRLRFVRSSKKWKISFNLVSLYFLWGGFGFSVENATEDMIFNTNLSDPTSPRCSRLLI